MVIFIMLYKISKAKNYMKILGKDFVNNNKNKGYIISNNKKLSLREQIKFNSTKITTNFKIKMILNWNISKVNSMFENCSELLICKEINELDDNFIINEEDYMLYENISSFYEDIQNEEDCYKDYYSYEEKSSLILDNNSLDNEKIEKKKDFYSSLFIDMNYMIKIINYDKIILSNCSKTFYDCLR